MYPLKFKKTVPFYKDQEWLLGTLTSNPLS